MHRPHRGGPVHFGPLDGGLDVAGSTAASG